MNRRTLIEYRTHRGSNAEESLQLLNKIVVAHSGNNLAHALHYNGFISKHRAESAAAALEAENAGETRKHGISS